MSLDARATAAPAASSTASAAATAAERRGRDGLATASTASRSTRPTASAARLSGGESLALNLRPSTTLSEPLRCRVHRRDDHRHRLLPGPNRQHARHSGPRRPDDPGVTEGSAVGTRNTQLDALQFGLDLRRPAKRSRSSRSSTTRSNHRQPAELPEHRHVHRHGRPGQLRQARGRHERRPGLRSAVREHAASVEPAATAPRSSATACRSRRWTRSRCARRRPGHRRRHAELAVDGRPHQRRRARPSTASAQTCSSPARRWPR